MKKRVGFILLGIAIVLLGRGGFYYSGLYQASPSEMPSFEHIVVPEAASTEYSDVYGEWEGTVLIDLAHDNNFDVEELNVLISRLISRGLSIKFLSVEEELGKELLGEEEEDMEEEEKEEEWEEEELEEEIEEELEEELEEDKQEKELLVANAFIIVCPQTEFSEEARETVSKFVNNCGKLLLIGDPTRRGEINSLSLKFGLIFEPDYLYNLKENDTNYRNIFITEFEENEITKDLEKIALYTAGSITSTDGGIALVDENTFSSLIETRKKLSPMAFVQESKVLAVYDLTFITEPYNGMGNNNQLISNIADWLASPAEELEVEEGETKSEGKG